jgi:hypothetical protein
MVILNHGGKLDDLCLDESSHDGTKNRARVFSPNGAVQVSPGQRPGIPHARIYEP